MRIAGSILLHLGLAALVGGMLFFGVVMAPLVFLHLPIGVAGPFIRGAFPRYYGYCVGAACFAAVGLLLRREFLALLVPVAIVAVTAWLWLYLLPALDVMRAAHDTVGFARGHRLAVWLNGAEILAAMVLLIKRAIKLP
jgi:hypothetical protein